MTDPREVTAITLANQARQRCICLEDNDVTVCQCPTPITRELAWLQAPFDVPPEADLQHAVDLGTLLDVLGAPPAAVLS
jgi:hypothetical protein